MKRAPYTYGADESGKKYWRSLDEFAETPAFTAALEQEFPEGASILQDPVGRRSFMGLMGASLGLAGLTGCRRPEQHILPYNKRPEGLIPGISQFYATVMPFGATAIGLLVESHEGRPTKIEGNPQHPHSQGASSAWVQASVLELYDPDRSTGPAAKGVPSQKMTVASDWKKFWSALAARATVASGKAGQGLVILTESHRSPTLAAQLNALQAKLPRAKIVRYDPQSRQSERDGLAAALGEPLEASADLAAAKIILAIDSDLLLTDGSPIKQSQGYAKGRDVTNGGETMNRLYAVESRFSITGASADHRLRLASRDIPAFTAALANELAGKHGLALGDAASALGGLAQGLPSSAAKWVTVVAKDLVENRGASAVIAGHRQPSVVHALAALINTALGNAGKTVSYHKPFDVSPDGPAALVELSKSIQSGGVETLLILGGNPAFTAPADADFRAALAKVPYSAHLSGWINETSKLTTWHVPQAHFLESWGDASADDGVTAIIQPLIAPLHDGLTESELVERFTGGSRQAYDLVRSTWAGKLDVAGVFETGWRRALHEGVIPNTASASVAAAPTPVNVANLIRMYAAPAKDGFEITFHPDSHAWDGRFANNGWMQEMPDQMTKQTWGNAALLSSSTAQKLGVTDGDFIEIKTRDGHSAKLSALIAPGQADDSIAVTFGQGRTEGMNQKIFEVDGLIGVDTYPLRSSGAFYVSVGAAAVKADGHQEIARTQEHHTIPKGREILREGSLVQFKQNPRFAPEKIETPRLNLWSENDDVKYDGLKWGMTIDLNSCTGCNACMIACQAENNIPLTGRVGVLRNREMHWIRVDRYYEGDDVENPRAAMQPVGCQQCENAPCELVCPVAATEHSPEGLNEMAYNRCVGTRYCANNCPYKVRRFNFFNYNGDVPELRKMQFNPNVTVRSRGVMEKCTYCVQRIQEGKIAAKREGRIVKRHGHDIAEVRDGDIVSACAQACPTQAIKFGDLNDDKSAVARNANGPRAYGLLGELNTRPRTSFLARIRNPHPELEKA
jgi:MoCo/4Fe-4S cofactor protein with predicted Tat translocation signal